MHAYRLVRIAHARFCIVTVEGVPVPRAQLQDLFSQLATDLSLL
jgi:hypothetical protein